MFKKTLIASAVSAGLLLGGALPALAHKASDSLPNDRLTHPHHKLSDRLPKPHDQFPHHRLTDRASHDRANDKVIDDNLDKRHDNHVRHDYRVSDAKETDVK